MLKTLPDSLLLLVHLHLLNYPLKDAAGYDEQLFNPTVNGMRERTKAMEDICYFLVSKVQGGREHAKAILPTYPCLQPSDTTAFRMSLAKHLEILRHGIVYPSHADTERKGTSKSNLTTSDSNAANAWWWKDVVVRRSLLEECCGERFERLLLALSTHALLKVMPNPTTGSNMGSSTPDQTTVLADRYMHLLACAQSDRHAWERSASLLLQRQSDLALLRERLKNPDPTLSSSKYDILSTDRLVALQDSRLKDLLRKYWKDDQGQRAFSFLTDLAGLRSGKAESSIVDDAQHSDSHVPKVATKLPTAPLPIAAAHHPTHLRSLSLSLFTGHPALSAPISVAQASAPAAVSDPAARAVAERIDSAARMQQALQGALARAEAVRREAQTNLQSVQAATGNRTAKAAGVTVDLWQAPVRGHVDFSTTAAPSILDAFGLPRPLDAPALEARIADIRSNRLTAYPPLPSEAPYPPQVSATRLPPPSEKTRGQIAPALNTNIPQFASNVSGKPKLKATALSQKNRAPSARASHTDHPQAQYATPRKSSRTHVIKSARRSSRRVSTARARRSAVFSLRKTSLDDEVDRILGVVEDTDDFVALDDVASTPLRKGTSGNLLSSLKKSAARPSFDIEKHERAGSKLPALRLSGAQEDWEERTDPPDEDWTDDEPAVAAQELLEDVDEDDEGFNEGHSVTLKDILLGARGDVTQYDLLGADEPDDESLEWD